MLLRRRAALITAIAGAVVAAVTMPPALGATAAAKPLNFLYGVSCPKARWCMAVGSRFAPSQRTLAELWNATRWRVLATPGFAGGRGHLASVSCLSPQFCLAVGTRFTKAGRIDTGLIEQWNGSTWRLRHLTLPAGTLNSVSCQRRACMLVGDKISGASSMPLAARLTGTRLRVQKPPIPSGGRTGGLIGVSCVSASFCMAVGGYYDPRLQSSSTDLAEVWNGSRWRVTSTPHPNADTALQSVSCPTAATCVAAGWPVAGIGLPRVLTLVWQTGRWNSLKVTGPGHRLYTPDAVSCWASSACVTAGFINGGNAGGLAAERWNGEALRFMFVSRSAGILLAISCPVPKRCVAVGGEAQPSTANRGGAIAELWNGSRWRQLPVTGP